MDAITGFDQRVLEALYSMRELSVSYVFIWISELGRVPTILGITLIAALLLAARQYYAYATGLIMSVALSGIIIFLGKGLIERARPDEFYQAYKEAWYSFPSAHAALATALYGFFMYLAWDFIRSPLVRFATLAIAILLIGSVAFGRLYLGVHFFSDVFAGIVLGALCVWIGARATSSLRA